MAVTIKDVAALAGVSPSTVSRTCKNNSSISEETKERVRKAMLELGYEPNFQASNLASQNIKSTEKDNDHQRPQRNLFSPNPDKYAVGTI